MRSNQAFGLIFANMHDETVRDITSLRSFGSIPFGGRYRLVDFVLSDMVNAGIVKVGMVTKNNAQSLMDHIGSGKAWGLSRKNEGLYFLPPAANAEKTYEGRVTSLIEASRFLRHSKEDYVVMSDCYTVGTVDYAAIIDAHIRTGADITVAYQKDGLPSSASPLFLKTDDAGRITDIRIGGKTDGDGHGIGVYIVGRSLLLHLMEVCASYNQIDFERDVLQRRLGDLRIFGYEVPERVLSICSLESYFDANMTLLDPEIRTQIFSSKRPVYTKVRDCAPALYGLHSDVRDCLVGEGSVIEGTVRHSVIFRNVRVAKGAVVENCILMQGTEVGENARLNSVITDKNVVVRDGRSLQGADSYPLYVRKNTLV